MEIEQYSSEVEAYDFLPHPAVSALIINCSLDKPKINGGKTETYEGISKEKYE